MTRATSSTFLERATMKKKKRTRPTPEDLASWAEGKRQLAERIAIVEQQIAEAKKREQSGS